MSLVVGIIWVHWNLHSKRRATQVQHTVANFLVLLWDPVVSYINVIWFVLLYYSTRVRLFVACDVCDAFVMRERAHTQRNCGSQISVRNGTNGGIFFYIFGVEFLNANCLFPVRTITGVRGMRERDTERQNWVSGEGLRYFRFEFDCVLWWKCMFRYAVFSVA